MSFFTKPDPKAKFQYFMGLVYPDSAPENWLNDLRMIGRPFAVSPLHDKDTHSEFHEDGAYISEHNIKPHYHVLLNWENTTTYRTVDELWKSYNQPHPFVASSPRSCFKYLWHADDPDKYPYNENDVRLYNGFDPACLLKLTQSEVTAYLKQIRQIIKQRNITNYMKLLDELESMADDQLYQVAYQHSMHISRCINAQWQIDCAKKEKEHKKYLQEQAERYRKEQAERLASDEGEA